MFEPKTMTLGPVLLTTALVTQEARGEESSIVSLRKVAGPSLPQKRTVHSNMKVLRSLEGLEGLCPEGPTYV